MCRVWCFYHKVQYSPLIWHLSARLKGIVSTKWKVGREAKLRGHLWTFSQGHYPPIYQQTRKGIIYSDQFLQRAHFIVVKKTDSENEKAHFQLNKCNLVSLLGFITLWLDLKSWNLKRDFLSCFSLVNRIGRQLSPDSRRPILYHVVCFIQWLSAKINRWVIKELIYSSFSRNIFYYLIKCWFNINCVIDLGGYQP